MNQKIKITKRLLTYGLILLLGAVLINLNMEKNIMTIRGAIVNEKAGWTIRVHPANLIYSLLIYRE